MYKSGKVVAMHGPLGKGVIESFDRQLGKFSLPFYLLEAQTDIKVGDTVSFLDNFFRASMVRRIPVASAEGTVVSLTVEGDKK